MYYEGIPGGMKKIDAVLHHSSNVPAGQSCNYWPSLHEQSIETNMDSIIKNEKKGAKRFKRELKKPSLPQITKSTIASQKMIYKEVQTPSVKANVAAADSKKRRTSALYEQEIQVMKYGIRLPKIQLKKKF